MSSIHSTSSSSARETSLASAPRRSPGRHVTSLNGVWQVEQGGLETPPVAFLHTVAVPGLVDLAVPAFADVGKVSGQRQAFWYRRSFDVENPIPAVAILKFHKFRFGAKVWLNGELLGEHLPCFTPGEFDARALLRPGQNELLVRLGANRELLPPDQPSGQDFEKYLFLPGICDAVELILSGAPFIRNIQTVPDIIGGRLRVVAEIAAGAEAASFQLQAAVAAVREGQAPGAAAAVAVTLAAGQVTSVDFSVPMPDARLWSPEDPFLYELTLSTGGDTAQARFGMRTFRFDPVAKCALLNGKPCYLRGSNITIERFYEDAERSDLPWNPDWVRKLHRRIKEMNWNALRYCIGFPPEFWYEIADEEGILIQDEFPVWMLDGDAGNPEHRRTELPIAEKLAVEYTAWIRERWNHPCVVIWDAQNESITDETGKARDAVRHFDLSNRPWENGWGLPGTPTDVMELHPYLFMRGWRGAPFFLREMAGVAGKPFAAEPQLARYPNLAEVDVPIIINEYCWLWIDRKGRPTCLTQKVYESLVGPDATADQRRLVHARYVAALTEFWRCHRKVAGVLHFCSLGYSRDGSIPRPEGGATSDDWIDVRELTMEPYFAEYVREAFAPVGVMLDFWADYILAGASRPLHVVMINDLEQAWSGRLRLRVLHNRATVSEQIKACALDGYERRVLAFDFAAPRSAGRYTIEAAVLGADGVPTRSLRDFVIGEAPKYPGLILQHPVS